MDKSGGVIIELDSSNAIKFSRHIVVALDRVLVLGSRTSSYLT